MIFQLFLPLILCFILSHELCFVILDLYVSIDDLELFFPSIVFLAQSRIGFCLI
ncbi:hypothetical protein Hdeb2414_s0005g00180291 [Helianthus debilis subsp. tardiflorus]